MVYQGERDFREVESCTTIPEAERKIHRVTWIHGVEVSHTRQLVSTYEQAIRLAQRSNSNFFVPDQTKIGIIEQRGGCGHAARASRKLDQKEMDGADGALRNRGSRPNQA